MLACHTSRLRIVGISRTELKWRDEHWLCGPCIACIRTFLFFTKQCKWNMNIYFHLIDTNLNWCFYAPRFVISSLLLSSFSFQCIFSVSIMSKFPFYDTIQYEEQYLRAPKSWPEASLICRMNKTKSNYNVGQCPTWWPPAEYRCRRLFNAAKFGWRPLLECRAVTLPRRKTRWN